MPQRILIDPVTRIEGHAKISIFVDDNNEILSTQFHVVEFRGFEHFVVGRPFHETPGIMARICGICPISHILASAKAGDALLGVEIPVAAQLQRRLLSYAQTVQSHALSFFHLSSPDFLLGFDSDPAKRNIFGLAAEDPDFARRGIALRAFGQKIIEKIGGQRIHPYWGVPGGVLKVISPEERDELAAMVPAALESAKLAIERMKTVVDKFPDEAENLGHFPMLYLGTVSPEGKLDLYDGVLRIVDGEGNTAADRLDPRRFATYLGEASEEWSFMKFAYYKPMGYPGGAYCVGPLARLNVCSFTGTPLADRELREFRHRGAEGSVNHAFQFHLARLIEILHGIEYIEELLADPALLSKKVRARAGQNHNAGVGSCEAPRGTLFHSYEVDDNGLVMKANLLIATSQNNLAINRAVEEAARRFVSPGRLTEGMLNRVEAAVRCYDPCLSCSTHALGAMPMEITLRNRGGEILDRVAR